MAETKLADVIVPEVYNPYVIQKETELSKIIQSGIATRDPDIVFPNMSRAAKGGKTIHIPFWKSIVTDDEDDEIITETSAVVNNITADESVAAVHLRRKAWGASDLAGYFAGSDPMAAIGTMNAAFWANRMQRVLLRTLEGITDKTAGALKEHVLDISGETGDAAVLSSSAMVDAIYKMGDHAEDIAGILMNSQTMAKLVKLNLIDTIRDADNNIEYKAYMGKTVIVDDGLKATGGAYPIYFFGQGAIAFNEETRNLELTETDRDTLAGTDILVTRRAFVMHPRGLKWVGTAASTTPSNTELATAANWELADNIKNVPITKLIAKLA